MLETRALPAPSSFDTKSVPNFGVEILNGDPKSFSEDEFKEIKDLLYKHDILLWRGVKDLQPEQQYRLTKAFDPQSEVYGHGNNKTGHQTESILHPDLKTLPQQPQVQLIGNGVPTDERITRGLDKPKLKHPHHKTFHKTVVSDKDEKKGDTRFYRWHIDAALYDLDPPHVTTLYGLSVPDGANQTVRYDDGSDDTLEVPLGTTAFVSGNHMFELLSPEYKSLAVRSKVQYAPHPYIWVSSAKSNSVGLGMVTDNLELPPSALPPIEESKIKRFPMLWKNPVTGNLHFQVHPTGAQSIHVDPLPKTADRTNALFPEGTHITDLKEVRELLYLMQRPAIAPHLVFPMPWKDDDLVLFHNRGVLHTVVGAFREDEVRAFWQCNLAAKDSPLGPSEEDIEKYS